MLGHDGRVIALGVNGFAGADHDAAAALVVDGRVVAAVEEERLNRRRHAPGCRPRAAVPEVLDIAGIAAREIDVVCHGWRPEALGLEVKEAGEAENIRRELAAAGVELRPDVPVRFIDHHLAHFWSGVPFIPPGADRTAVDGLVIDGAGESTSGAMFRFREGRVRKPWNLGASSSLGILYEAATMAIGFRPGDEGKTMGLASYGRMETMDGVTAPADDRFDGPIPALSDRDELRQLHWACVKQMRSIVPAGASFNRRADFALGVQTAVEQRIMSYLDELGDPAPVLVLAGGVALNCTINAVVARWCADRGSRLVIPPPANDAGIAVGAAVAMSPEAIACTADSAYLGRGFRTGEIVSRLAALGVEARDLSPAELAEGLLERDLLCGWFEGRAEVGPRALGRRAILARPDSTRIRDRLNVLKGRENWRPLAPSVLAEEFLTSFEGTPSPHMLIASEVRGPALRPLAGVAHVDNTARPQVVNGRPDDGPYAELLREMAKRTGHAAVTCTSFNVAGKPIVYTPEDALQDAVAIGLDLLAGDGWCVPVPRG
jgi:carbamoyltransferase